jgi:YidC/Oxa1 family membrane protein insertase
MFHFLQQIIFNALILLYNLLFSNLGLAIIALTALIRLALVPLTNPQLKAAQKMQELSQELDKLKKKFKDDKQKLMQAQMELYKKHGVNPAAGCLPQILQFILLISLYQVFNQIITAGDGIMEKLAANLYSFVAMPSSLNLSFLHLNLSRPDVINLPGLPFPLPGIFVVLAAIFQFLSSKMMAPIVKAEEKEAQKTENKGDDMAVAMQKQMLYLFPIMTLVLGFTLPSGVTLYWFVFSVFSLAQQILINKRSLSLKK